VGEGRESQITSEGGFLTLLSRTRKGLLKEAQPLFFVGVCTWKKREGGGGGKGKNFPLYVGMDGFGWGGRGLHERIPETPFWFSLILYHVKREKQGWGEEGEGR